jgi:hypothetical protein
MKIYMITAINFYIICLMIPPTALRAEKFNGTLTQLLDFEQDESGGEKKERHV